MGGESRAATTIGNGVSGAGAAAALFAARFASGQPIVERVAVVVAHPDDETLWVGSLLPRLVNALLIHVTDGAPHDMADARRLGFATREDYAAVRAAELDAALALLGAAPERRAYGIADQDAMAGRAALVDRLADDLAGAAVVVTHPYEHGHPDHDTCAHAVRAAVDRLTEQDRPAPAIVEFACYHLRDGERRFGAFWPGEADEHVRTLPDDERDRIAAALAAHASQAAVIDGWVPTHERWRAAPAYDFAAPAAPGGALYDGFGWAMTAARWRGMAAA